MNLEDFHTQLTVQPDTIEFDSVMALIDAHYDYQAASFSNGIGEQQVHNEAGTNEGSCRLFAFAADQQLTKEQTLHCFGRYYREDVLGKPDGKDHANIRAFMVFGWEGIHFESLPLSRRS